jgi:hypothetical protein
MTRHSAGVQGGKPTQARDQWAADDLPAQQRRVWGHQVLGKRLRLQCFAGSLLADAPAIGA